jgi:filamentous hemagglutinin
MTGADLDELLESGLMTSAITAVSSVGYQYVGDYAQAAGLSDGDIQKVLSHAVIGGLSSELTGGDFRTGAIAAAMTELGSTFVEGASYDPQMRVKLAGLIGGVAAAIAGGDGNEVTIAANISETIRVFNHELHPSAKSVVRTTLAKAKMLGTVSEDLTEEDILNVMEAMAESHVRYLDDGIAIDLSALAELSPDAIAFVMRRSILGDLIITDGNENEGIGKGIVNGVNPTPFFQLDYDNPEQAAFGESIENAILVSELFAGGVGIAKLGVKVAFKNGDTILEIGEQAAKGTKLKYDNVTKSWESPAGLIYEQSSKDGNRIKHVLEHLKENPNKPLHTIFNVESRDLLGVVDEAWKKRTGPGLLQGNGNRVWQVNLGRAIGTQGETSVQIVVKDGTNKLITAFPK